MSKTILLTDLRINNIYINYDSQTVTVLYSMTDTSGITWINSEATFWVTLPPQTPIYSGSTITGYEPHPESWFQLPASYVPTLLQLKSDADIALTNRFLV